MSVDGPAYRAGAQVRVDRTLGPLVTQGTRFGDLWKVLLLAGLILVAAIVLRGPRVAARCALVIAGANVTTQILQRVLSDPSRAIGGVVDPRWAFPSGHVTGTASVAVCACVIVGGRLRGVVVALAGLLVITVSASLVLNATHLLSDVVGAWCVVAAWSFAALPAADETVHPAQGRIVGAALVAGIGGLLAVGAAGGLGALGRAFEAHPAVVTVAASAFAAGGLAIWAADRTIARRRQRNDLRREPEE